MSSVTGKLSPPYAHQMELHAYLPQDNFISWHKSHDIHVTAYSPLGNMNPTYSKSIQQVTGEKIPSLLSNKIVGEIAEARGCTPAQVVLKWGMTRGTSVIPKSAHAGRIDENFESTECHLEKKDFQKLEQLPTKRFNNPSEQWGVKLFDGLDDASAVSMDRVMSGISSFLNKIAGFWSGAKERLDI